jgi:hypothetical protein
MEIRKSFISADSQESTGHRLGNELGPLNCGGTRDAIMTAIDADYFLLFRL